MDCKPWRVIKFGGTSVSSRVHWDSIAQITIEHQNTGHRVVIVCSAISTASDDLHQLAQLALTQEHQDLFDRLQEKYRQLALELAVDASVLQPLFANLNDVLARIHAQGELTPQRLAQVMATGERALTGLGVLFLKSQGLDIDEAIAADLLQVVTIDGRDDVQYLSGYCHSEADETLQNKMDAYPSHVITQGFVASNEAGEIVLLGRGGSDISAAYFSAKLAAVGCDIWTDVAGIYSADPRLIPGARVLRHIRYDEAQEISAMGGRILHPRTIPPLKQARIPLFIKQTLDPAAPGTKISWEGLVTAPCIKSISVKKKVILISMEALSMWQTSGFLASIFSCFKKHHLSVDLVSTAESCVTVSLDMAANLLDGEALSSLLDELNQFSRAQTIGPCAAISLIGQDIRVMLSELTDVFSQFQSHPIYLVTQAANDLNLSFVIDEDRADYLCQKLHHLLIENKVSGKIFGAAWRQAPQIKAEESWWEKMAPELLRAHDEKYPCYVYLSNKISERVGQLQALAEVDRLYYAMKANSNKEVLAQLIDQGLFLECVSWGEVTRILEWFPQYPLSHILFTPNFAPREEYEKALNKGILVTLDSSYPLQAWPELWGGQSVMLRVDPGEGKGHHKHVMTAGQSAKFGLPPDQLVDWMAQAKSLQLKVVGLHAHAGSGILEADHWANIAYFLVQFLPHCPDVTYINAGGGLGISQSAEQQPLDLNKVNNTLAAFKKDYPNMRLWLEPGRFLVAESGVLLARVTQIKHKGEKIFIGIETGMNSLLRPALYGAYHPIVNLSRCNQVLDIEATVVGPICESADVLGIDRLLPKTEQDDVLAIGNVGAYGECMSSRYNLREPAQSFLWHAEAAPGAENDA